MLYRLSWSKWREVLEQNYRDRWDDDNPGFKHNYFSSLIGGTWNVARGLLPAQ